MIDLDALRRAQVFGPLDVQFARTLARMTGDANSIVELGAALVSRQTREGHVCANLKRFGGEPIRTPDGEPVAGFRFPSGAEWVSALQRSSLVRPDWGTSPLVLDDKGRLYLRRYWEHERRLAVALRERVRAKPKDLDVTALRKALTHFFGAPEATLDHQRLAVQIASLSGLLVLSGGPGTGKTSTIVRLVAVLITELRARGVMRPQTLLMAPTGKAAARMVESVKKARIDLARDAALSELIPENASTIHRALGAVGQLGNRFRHDAENPLPADIVVVDEASMVDVALMRRLVEAVRPEARLVIVGDADQLASVEAGAVLAELCAQSRAPRYSRALANEVKETFGDEIAPEWIADGPLRWDDCVVRLTKSYRFDAASAIGELSTAIRAGNASSALHLLHSPPNASTTLHPTSADRPFGPSFADLVRRGFAPATRAIDAAHALEQFEAFRVLCGHRKGPDGVETANRLVENILEGAGLLRVSGAFYAGRPILVTENDYQVGLFNGDVGLVWREPGSPAPRAYFRAPDGSLRTVATSRLPAHETAFAISIHKSQGSEFDDVAIVLPSRTSPILTRELLYTAVSRARKSVTLFSDPESVRIAIERRVFRDSGLNEALQTPLR